jgi:hypothetical protein
MCSLYFMYCEPPGHQGGHQGAHPRKLPSGGSSRYRWRWSSSITDNRYIPFIKYGMKMYLQITVSNIVPIYSDSFPDHTYFYIFMTVFQMYPFLKDIRCTPFINGTPFYQFFVVRFLVMSCLACLRSLVLTCLLAQSCFFCPNFFCSYPE